MQDKIINIGINASFLRKPDSGIGQVTGLFLKTLIKWSRDLENQSGPIRKEKLKEYLGEKLFEKFAKTHFYLYLEEEANLELPENFSVRVFLPKLYKRDDLIRKIIWEKFLLPKRARRDLCQVFFSLYQSPTIFSKIKHFMLVHDVIWRIFPEYLGNLRKKAYYHLVEKGIEKASKIFTVSDNSKKDISEILNIPHQKIITNYIDCDPIYRIKINESEKEQILRRYKLKNKNYIFYIGGFEVRKNVAAFIRAYGILANDFKTEELPELVLAGKFHAHLVPLCQDIESEIKNVLEKNKFLKDKIKMIGFVPQEDLPFIYSGAQIFCFPSTYEGFGMMPLEAMAVGVPVVTEKNSSLKELFLGGVFFAQNESAESLAKALVEVLKNEELQKELIGKGFDLAKKFSWENFTKKILEEILM